MQAITSGRVPEPRTLGKHTVVTPCPSFAETPVEHVIAMEREERLTRRRQVGVVRGMASIEYMEHNDTFEVRIDDCAFPEMHIHFVITPEMFEQMKQEKEQ